ncbi:MAG: hypothetical protein ABWW70_06170, partial [Thermoproteota archaeon]
METSLSLILVYPTLSAPAGFEWKLLLFLVGVFTLSGAFAKHGLANRLADLAANWIVGIGSGNTVT